jgi:cobalamin biosynthesis Mg chelatase CobN
MRSTVFAAALCALFALGIVAGCGSGGGGERTAALTGLTGATVSTPTRSVAAPTLPDPTVPERTITETSPAETVTAQETRTAVVERTTTAVQTQPVTITATTTAVSPAAAAAAGAAVATQQEDEESTTQWGWIAFGILALAVIVFAIVWWIRRRQSARPAT